MSLLGNMLCRQRSSPYLVRATPACGSTVTAGQSVSVTVTVTPNPGTGQLVALEGFCGGSSTGLTSLDTNANGQVTVTSAGATTLCLPADAFFLFTFSSFSDEKPYSSLTIISNEYCKNWADRQFSSQTGT